MMVRVFYPGVLQTYIFKAPTSNALVYLFSVLLEWFYFYEAGIWYKTIMEQ